MLSAIAIIVLSDYLLWTGSPDIYLMGNFRSFFRNANAFAGFTGLFLLANKVEYKTVYTNLSVEDAASIVEKLKEEQVPYKMAGDGSAINVPAGRVYDTRLILASHGLPKGSGVGYEIFDKCTN